MISWRMQGTVLAAVLLGGVIISGCSEAPRTHLMNRNALKASSGVSVDEMQVLLRDEREREVQEQFYREAETSLQEPPQEHPPTR